MRIEMGHGHAAPFLIDMFVYLMITTYCTKFDRLTNRKFMEIVGTRGKILMAKCTEIDFGWGSAPDPAGRAYDAPPDLLVGWGGGYPSPYLTPLGAYGASTLASSALVSAPAAPRPLGASLRRPSAFGCLTEAKAHLTSSFWRRHCCQIVSRLNSHRPPDTTQRGPSCGVWRAV